MKLASDEQQGLAPLNSRAFWQAYGLTLRPYLCVVSGSSGLLGLALVETQPWMAFGVLLAFFLAYGLGQALTDVFQVDTDSLSAPYRPLVQGRLSRGQVLVVSLAGLGLCALVLAAANPATLLPSGLAVFGLLSYSFFKRRWWGGPLWNAWIVALLPVIGYLCGGHSLREAWLEPRVRAASASVLFGYAVFVLLGYFKDISADRATGYRTLPVSSSWRLSVTVSAGFALATVGAGLYFLELVIPPWHLLGIALWLAGTAALIAAHPYMLRLGSEDEAYRAIALALRGYVLIHLGLATAVRPELGMMTVAIYVLFEWALRKRPDMRQI